MTFSFISSAFGFFSDRAIEVLQKNHLKFKKIEFAEKDGALAVLRPIADEGVRIGDEFYRGVRVTIPDWLAGSVLWMIASDKIGPMPDNKNHWRVIPISGDQKEIRQISTVFSDPENGRFRTYQRLFPHREKFAQIWVPRLKFTNGQDYLFLYAREDGLIPDTEFAFTCYSLTGEKKCGILPTAMPDAGPNRSHRTDFESSARPRKEFISEGRKIFNEEGRDRAREFFDRELDDYHSKGGMFFEFHRDLWQEAQTGAGRQNKEWAAFGFEYITNKAWKYEAFDFSSHSAGNAVETLLRVHRIASAEQSFLPFRYFMQRQGLSREISSYPASKDVFATFPEIKLRNLPKKPPKRISFIRPMGDATNPKNQLFRANTIYAFQQLAALDHIKGEWKSALEWQLAAAELATSLEGFGKDTELHESYFANLNGAAISLTSLGFYEEALDLALSLREERFQKKISYWWRAYQISDVNVMRCKLELGTLERSDREWIDSRVKKLRANRYVHKEVVQDAELIQLRIYLASNDAALKKTALEALEKLASDDQFLPARLFRVELLMGADSLAGLEEELISLLKQYRESGRKIDEWKLYSFYAEFLLKNGRLKEALAMQREALRLIKTFDLFPFEPLERMKLARVLFASGLEREAARESAVAKSLVANTKRFSGPHLERIKKSLESFEMKSSPVVTAKVTPSSLGISLQPTRSLIVPIEGKAGQAKFTLMNLSNQVIEGTLALSGTKVDLTYLESEASVVAIVGKSGKAKLEHVKLEPGTYLLLSLEQDVKFSWEGEIQIDWNDSKESASASVTFEKEESGVSSAVIDAGNYQLNEFYGVPIHHHFHNAGNDSELDFRVKTSMAARVEGYDANDKLLFVDANGNGSFLDPGDIINLDEDGSGYPDLPLENGEALFRLQVYPQGAPTAEGIEVSVEGQDGKDWRAMSINHLSFPDSENE